jgi:DNA replication protein DnaC
MTSLRLVKDQIQEFINSGQLKTGSSDACQVCYGSGFEMIEDLSRRCRCRRPAMIAARLEKIPPRYKGITLDNLAARTDLHPKQAVTVDLLKLNPNDSYVFCGRPGTGKTHFMYALYQQQAHNLERRVVACSMLHLINDYREAFKPIPDGAQPYEIKTIKPNDLMQSHTPYSLFFDDIDKPKITEYVAEQVHALFDAAYLNKHQIVITTNLDEKRLIEHFSRTDERYGEAIVRRIIHEDNNVIEFF